MKVRMTLPNLVVLARDESRRKALGKLGFGVEQRRTKSGAEFMSCKDDLTVEMTLGKLMILCRDLKLVGTIFPDGSISLEGA